MSFVKPCRRWLNLAVGKVIAFALFRTLKASYKFHYHETEHCEQAKTLAANGSFIMSIWHDCLLATTMAHCYQKIGMLISPSYMGDLIAFTVERTGYRTFRGSSSRRGKEALKEFYDAQKSGWRIGITVDGPKGPRHKVRPGAISIAQKTGIPILPAVSRAEQSWVLQKTWDKFRIPKPFSNIHVLYGKPIVIPSELTSEDFDIYQEKLSSVLKALDKQVDDRFAASQTRENLQKQTR